MANLTLDQIKTIVAASLKKVADLPNEIENATLTNMAPTEQAVFLSALKTNLNAFPYVLDDSTTSDAAYYDIDLTPDTFNLWATVGDCIAWINKNQEVDYRNK